MQIDNRLRVTQETLSRPTRRALDGMARDQLLAHAAVDDDNAVASIDVSRHADSSNQVG